MNQVRKLIDKLNTYGRLNHDEYVYLLENRNENDAQYLFGLAREKCIEVYGHDIYLRGLIEFTNYCKNDCFYCGIRRSNDNADRYRLTENEIVRCCETGYGFNLRTFVLQGGEDQHFTEEDICRIVYRIKEKFPDCAVTLSIGEKSKETYEAYYRAGADRYLLRHETATREHYRRLHPDDLSMENRMRCLKDLKDIGYQIGAGFMVGSPYQTMEYLANDFEYLKTLNPHMIGIGPFIHHKDTPFREESDGTLELTLYCLGILRLMFPRVLLPATTALGTIDPLGREKGIKAGANVIMPSLSPKNVKKKYMLYDGKICTGDKAAEAYRSLEKKIETIGYHALPARGDYKGWTRK